MKNVMLILVTILVTLWACDEGDPIDKNPENPINPEDTITNPIDTVNSSILTAINQKVNALVIDKENVKWIGTDSALYKSVENGYKKVEVGISGSISYMYYEMSDNILWIGTSNDLYELTFNNDEITTLKIDQNNLSNPQINCLHIDHSNKHWFATEKSISLNKDGLWKTEKFRVNSQGNIFKMTLEDFAINSITSWDGDYYFATSGYSLVRAFEFNDEVDAFTGATQWESPYNGPGITDTMFVVFVDKDENQWFGGKEGIQVHVGHDAKDFNAINYYFDELPDAYILAINQAPDGKIWVGTRKGLAVFDGSEWKIITENLPSKYITAIAFDKNGSTWIGTKSGLVNIQ